MSAIDGVPYQTRPEMEDVLGLSPGQSDQIARLNRLLLVATGLIDRKVGRSFGPVTATRAFDAPGSVDLPVPDLRTITALTAYGQPLTVLDYELRPPGGDPPGVFRFIRLIIDGVSFITWGQLAPMESPDQQIIITGVWDEDVPYEITLACEMLCAKLWQMRTLHYGGASGNAVMGRNRMENGLWTSEVLELIAPFVVRPVPTVIGA